MTGRQPSKLVLWAAVALIWLPSAAHAAGSDLKTLSRSKLDQRRMQRDRVKLPRSRIGGARDLKVQRRHAQHGARRILALPGERTGEAVANQELLAKAPADAQQVSLRRLFGSMREGTLGRDLRQLMRTPKGQREVIKLSKSSTWRVLASADTALWTMFFTGSPSTALGVAAGESATKWFWRYGYESLWTNVLDRRLTKLSRMEKTRDLIKAIGWRVIGSVDTFLLSLAGTGGDMHTASAIAVAEAFTKIGLDFAHERAWRKVVQHKFPALAAKPLDEPALAEAPSAGSEHRSDSAP